MTSRFSPQYPRTLAVAAIAGILTAAPPGATEEPKTASVAALQWLRDVVGPVAFGVTTEADLAALGIAAGRARGPDGYTGPLIERMVYFKDGKARSVELLFEMEGKGVFSIGALRRAMGVEPTAETNRRGRKNGTTDSPIQPEDLYNIHHWCPVPGMAGVAVTVHSMIDSGAVHMVTVMPATGEQCLKVMEMRRRRG